MKIRTRSKKNLTINPFVSEAQRRACYAGAMPGVDCEEWQDKTPKDLPKRLSARDRRKAVRNAAKTRRVGANKIDPTGTTAMRRDFLKKVKGQFAILRGRVKKFVGDADSFGLAATENAFCPTGPGGGVDPSCSPVSSGSLSESVKKFTTAEFSQIRESITSSVPNEAATILTRGIANALPVKKPLYRGIQFDDYSKDKSLLSAEPGQEFDMNLSSWTTSQKLAKEYADKSWEPGVRSVVLSVKGAKAISTREHTPLGDSGEHISAGRFKVESVTNDSQGRILIALSQTSTFEVIPPTANAFCPGEGARDNSCSPVAKLADKGVEKVKASFAKFSQRYGRRGAIAIMAAMAVTMPLPGNIFAVLGIAEGVRAVATRLAKNESVDFQLLSDIRDLAKELGLEFDPDKFLDEWHKVEVIDKPTENKYQFISSPEKIEAFQGWLREQLGATVTSKSNEKLWKDYARAGYQKGAGRAFDDVNRSRRFSPGGGEFYAGSRDQFLRSSFSRPETVEKIQLLAGRSFDDLENVTADMSTRMSRTLTDGLTQGMNPREVARLMSEDIDVSEQRAEVIARTEIIRAHAEGQLDSMQAMGVAKVGAMVEFSTAGDDRVCPECSELEGQEYSLEDAHGIIPVHPQCRCAWVPAGFDDLLKEDDE